MPKFDPAFEKKLLEFEAKKPENRQLRLLDDIASIVQEFLLSFDQQQKDSKATSKQLGALVSDVREQLVELNKKELPDQPDFSKPIVAALEKLGKIDVKPEVKVNVPDVKVPKPEVNVQVDAPQVNVDTTTFEKIVKKDLPKAFEKAIALIPKTEIPQTDNSELLAAWEGISEQLVSIETATRMKPQLPTTLKVVNPDGSSIGSVSGSSYYESYVDTTTDVNLVYLGKATPGSATTDAAWQVKRYNKSTGQMSFADDTTTFTKQWSARTGYTY